MNRVFVSLYVLIVFSVISIGWGIDKLWQNYFPAPEVSALERALVDSLVLQLVDMGEQEEELSALGEALNVDLAIYDESDFAGTAFSQDLLAGKVLSTTNSKGTRSIYKSFGQDKVLRVTAPVSLDHEGAYTWLMLLFYSSIAIVIYLWVWPLSKDLHKLERHTRELGPDGLPEPIDIGTGSAIHHVAQAFNHMSTRIRELMASHREMTYAVSHEVRTPLARMKFALELADNTEDGNKKRDQLHGIKKDIAEMEALISALLSYASFEQSGKKLELSAMDLKALSDALIAEQSQLRPDLVIASACSLTQTHYLCEPHLMERAIHNVLSNAARYARTQVQVTMSEDEGGVLVEIDDDGEGVSEADAARIFQAFVRLESGADKSGYGLGLAIVKRILGWHGGSVAVTSSPTLGGAKFSLRWPKNV